MGFPQRGDLLLLGSPPTEFELGENRGEFVTAEASKQGAESILVEYPRLLDRRGRLRLPEHVATGGNVRDNSVNDVVLGPRYGGPYVSADFSKSVEPEGAGLQHDARLGH